MTYIIENATILKEDKLVENSVIIKENQISSFQQNLRKLNFFRMDAEPYIMTPAFAVLDTGYLLTDSYPSLKTYFTDHFLKKGCTIIFTYVKVTHENELKIKLKNAKNLLLNSPIDYLIGIRIPIHALTPTLIRSCRKEHVPAIFIEFQKAEELAQVPWGWIREAMFPYNVPLIPCLPDVPKKIADNCLVKWQEIMLKEKIPSLLEEVPENLPLSRSILNKIGLLPRRAGLMHGGEISYNLYLKSREIKNVDTTDLFLYHKERLVVTVHKGNVIRAGSEVLYKPGFGEHVKVKTPSFFAF